MDQLIPVINKLQDVFAAIGQDSIDLPQIVVLGSQSAGKSSVLENIVGRDFLPRGFGIVTRRPLVLQLYSIPPEEFSKGDSNRGEEWGEFLHLPGQKFFDFDEIRNEIVRETDRVTGRNKGISNKSINLKIFSPYVLNLTLVDLPGITKVPTGDQPEDIEEQIRAMCLEFASNPNAIILAVTAANQDLANSDGLKMARAVDPDGERTIGVLTKIDIMDHGTDCCDVLNNQVIPLKRGYIAVRNRSQKDIQENLPIRKGLQNEQDYFQKHPAYRNLLTKCGTKNLARTLSQMLMVHIRDCLPEIKTKISKMLVSVQTNLDAFGDSIDDLTPSQKGVTLLRLLSQFSTNLSNRVDGKGSTEAFNEMSELYGGARINFIFNEIFGKRLRQLDPFEGLDDDDIRTAIANANGIRPSLFVPEIAFDLLVRRQIARLEQPGLQCVDFVVEELQKMISQSETMEMHRFPELRDRVIDVSYMLLKRCVAPTSKMISNLISIELAYINTSHPDFIGGKAAVNAATQNRARVAGPGVPGPGGVIPPPNGDIPIATSAVAVPGMNLGSEKGYQGVFQSPSGAIKAGSMAGSSSAFAKPSSAYDDKGIKLAQVPDRMRCSALPTERERTETEIIKSLIRSYFDIVKKNIMDLVPKTIMRFLVFSFKDDLQNELVAELYKEQVLVEAMRETEEVASKRRAFREMAELLHRASEIVNEVRDFQPTA